MTFTPIRMSLWSIAVLTGFLIAQVTSADEPEGVSDDFTVHKGLVFSNTDRELSLDLFIPEAGDEPTPCVIVIQGGGFAAQDGQRFRPFAEYLAEHGFAAALISYRGRPDHEYQDTVADVKAAVSYVRRVSGQYNIDPEKIGAMGRSAGGTLTALLAVTGDVEDLEGDAGHPEFSSRIQAAVAIAGVFDFVARFTDERHIALQPNVDKKLISNGEWIGPPFAPDDEHWLRASAINHIDEDDPPILFIHCRDDTTVPWLQSQEMYDAMKRARTDPAITLYETGGHGFQTLGEEPMAEMVRFFKERL